MAPGIDMVWSRLTDLGDSSLLLPAAALLAWLLHCQRESSLAWRWAVSFCGLGLLIALSKLAWMGWQYGVPALDFHGFSGHTGLSCAFWAVALFAAASEERWRLPGLLAGLGLGAVIGVSRVVLGAHSVSEVIGGFVLGSCVAVWVCARSQGRPLALSRGAVGSAGVTLLGLGMLERAPTHQWLLQLVHHLRA